MTVKHIHSVSIYLSLLLFSISNISIQSQKKIDITTDSLLHALTNVTQQLENYSNKKTKDDALANERYDSIINSESILSNIHVAQRDEKGLIILPQSWSPFLNNYTFADTIIVNPVLLPVIFEGKILPAGMDFISKDSTLSEPRKYRLITEAESFASDLKQAERVHMQRREYYMQNPELIIADMRVLAEAQSISINTNDKKSVFRDLITADQAMNPAAPGKVEFKIKKLKWKKNSQHRLHLSQNYMSDNWNGTGGEKNYNIENYHRVDFNYKYKKLSIDNIAEWKLEFMSTPSDDIHSLMINTDFLRLSSVLGFEAFNHWAYSFRFEGKTQIFNSYFANKDVRKTSFLAPLVLNVGIGMNYKLENISKKDKYNNIKMSINVSPLSIKYTYVRDDKVDETRFGVKKGDKALTDYGSGVDLNMTYNLNRYMVYESKMKYFTNYEKVLVESENRFSFRFNQYFSTSIRLDMRFDDAIAVKNKDKKWGYFQYNERLTFGLEYKW